MSPIEKQLLNSFLSVGLEGKNISPTACRRGSSQAAISTPLEQRPERNDVLVLDTLSGASNSQVGHVLCVFMSMRLRLPIIILFLKSHNNSLGTMT